MIQPVLLCGGKGSRLWPLSREQYPKQYLPLADKHTLFQQTVTRARFVAGECEPLVICNTDHRFFVAEQLRAISSSGTIVLEPEAKNTAPAIAVGALMFEKQDPCLLFLPADHVMDDLQLKTAVERALPLVEQGYLVTLGIPPSHAETGYGYIRKGEKLLDGYIVDSFVEKPDRERAEAFAVSGEHFWNSGMVMCKASVCIAELQAYCPKLLEQCKSALAASVNDLDFTRLDAELFSYSPSESFDNAVLEKTDKCAMVLLDDSLWSDLGSWGSMYDVAEKDSAGNAIYGDVLVTDSNNCLVRSNSRLVATIGVDNLIIVETGDAVLVARKDSAQDVRNLVKALCDKDRVEALSHKRVYRPWGAYESVDISSRYQVKRITVNPGQQLSLQKHHHRAEHWVVVKGTAKITNGERELLLTEDQSTYIPLGNVHRLENPGRIPLELIEVQTGAYLGEDDIVRFDDVYGRSNSTS